jgi:hypothetical protein
MKQENNMEAIRGKMKDIEEQFNHAFPYLQLSITNNCKNISEADHRQSTETHNEINVEQSSPEELDGRRIIDESMTVEQLENILLNEFGCNAKVFRRSGNVWLQTKFTNSWTLKEQNQMGKETS